MYNEVRLEDEMSSSKIVGKSIQQKKDVKEWVVTFEDYNAFLLEEAQKQPAGKKMVKPLITSLEEAVLQREAAFATK